MAHVGDAPIDRYVVLEHLSEGGMGAIYVGKKLGAGGFEMEVVLKQLLPEFTQQEEFIDLFLREAKLSATLDHANIVHTIDLVTAGNEYFIVMEYLPGGDLRTLLKKAKRRGKRFSPAAAIYVAREVLSALSYAHAKRDLDGQPLKLIHRDVSPSNILLSYAGEIKLTDFGIAKAATHTSLFYKVKGKIGYMSPEQAKSEPMDSRSDLYSLAVCLYEILTGERLFVHAGLTTSADEIYSQPVPQISRKVSGIPPELDAIMSRALSISPALRFQTASELQEALMRCAHRNGLLMSAPELADELRDACGPIDQWRGDDDDDDLGYVQRNGTEVYDAGLDDDEPEELDRVESEPPMSVHSMAVRLSGPKVTQPRVSSTKMPGRPKTEIGRFAGVEMTSIINLVDQDSNLGAKPLVDLDLGPVLDLGTHQIPETPPAMRPDAILGEPTARGLPPPPPRLAPLPRPGRLSQPPPRLDELFPNPRSTLPSQPPPVGPVVPKLPQTPLPQGGIKPWMIVVTILLAAGIIAIIVALSGPNVSLGK